MTKYRNHADILVERLKDPDRSRQYLEVALEEFGVDGDLSAFLLALRRVAQAQGGMSKLARATKLNRANLYAALSSEGNPGFETINTIIQSLGMRFGVELARRKAKPKRTKAKTRAVRRPKSPLRTRATSKAL